MSATAFRLPRIALPRPGLDLERWAVIACDQYTAEPEYWQRVQALVGDAPSTLQLIYPEAHLDAADKAERIARIQRAMHDCLAQGLLDERDGPVYVERSVDGRTRRGLMLELDLEHYDFSPGSTSLIRPTEGTIVARLAPRIAVRREATLELPHVLVLIDDPGCTVIEPIAAEREHMALLYDTPLMLGGGHVSGRAVNARQADAALQALHALAAPQRFAQRYGVPEGTPPMLFAVGDGNHSLATAKAIWEQTKAERGPDHPSRWALVEVENIHDPALHFAPIHRLLLGVQQELRAELAAHFGPRLSITALPDAATLRARVAAPQAGLQALGLIDPQGLALLEIADAEQPLAVGTLQQALDTLMARGLAREIDYVHGDDVIERLGRASGCAGFHLPTLSQHELLTRVVHGGPLPRKTFSMGEAHEKRYYLEARRIR